MEYFLKFVRDRVSQFGQFFVKSEPPITNRWEYQKPFIKHQFKEGEKVLDVGSGADPFPYATVLADLYIEPTIHRKETFVSNGKPVHICDINSMPFEDKEFDYVVCSHVLEHVDNPVMACKELMRVGKAGYIETPTLMKDMLLSWAKGMHKWHIIPQGNTLFFFEYTERQKEGIRSQSFERLIFSTVYNPLQKAFNENQDVFNVMFEWENWFDVIVVKKNGEILK